MAMRLFLIYAVVELAVVVALASTIGFGWTVLVLLGISVLGFVLAGSQVKRHIRRLRSGLATPQGAVTDSALVALGTVLVFIPGLVTTAAGLLLLTAADPRRGPSDAGGVGRPAGPADHRRHRRAEPT